MRWYEKKSNEQAVSKENVEENKISMPNKEHTQQVENEEKNITIICQDVHLLGNLTSKDDLQMSGTIQGDIVSTKHIHVDGNVNGNLSCHSLELHNARIKGDIVCTSDAIIREGTSIMGNVTADNLTIGGYVEGNLMIKGALHLLKSASIQGTIEASSLESDKGAILKGQCTITN